MIRHLLLLFFLLLCRDVNCIDIRADSAILINAKTGAIIYEKNARTPRYPASITKIATALYALEKMGDSLSEPIEAKREAVASITEKQRENSQFKVNPHWIEVGGTHIGIKTGEILTLDALLHGMMLASGNDAANVIAQYGGRGSINQFIAELNDYMQSIGAKDTHFVCSHGHHHPDHITTAYDMAIIAKKAMENPHFKKIVSTEKFLRPQTNKQNPVTLVQTNKLIRKSSKYYYDKAIGIKTGHGSRAKETFVAAAEKNGRTLIAVLMHAKERRHIFEDAIALFEEAFQQPKLAKTFVKAGPQRYTLKLPGASKPVETYTEGNFRLEYYRGEDPKYQAWLTWSKNLKLPIIQGQKVGELVFLDSDKKVKKRVPLLAKKNIGYSFFHGAKMFFQLKAPLPYYIFASLFIAALIFLRTWWLNGRR